MTFVSDAALSFDPTHHTPEPWFEVNPIRFDNFRTVVREISNRGSKIPCFPAAFLTISRRVSAISRQFWRRNGRFGHSFRPPFLAIGIHASAQGQFCTNSEIQEAEGTPSDCPPTPQRTKFVITDGWRAIAVVSPAPDVSPPGVRVRHPIGVGRPSRLGRPPSLSPTRSILAATGNIKPLRHREGL